MSLPQASWQQAAAVGIGAAAGGLSRWFVSAWLNPLLPGLPLGTLTVNVVGGLLIGGIMAWLLQAPNELLRLLLVTGFLGGLTTFSAFTFESLGLLQRGSFGLALVHAATHLIGSLAAAALGFWVVSRWLA